MDGVTTEGTAEQRVQPDPPRRAAHPPDRVMVLMGIAFVVVVMAAIALGLDRMKQDVLVGIMTVLALAIASTPLLRWIAREDGEPGMAKVYYLALGTKFVGTRIRYYFIAVVYGDNGDAGVYHGAGDFLMRSYRQGIFFVEIPGLSTRGAETTRIAIVVGLIYLVTGVSRYAAAFVFSWLCFLGQVMMCRAFRRGVPEGDQRRYTILVMFLPSLVYWPSSIGKEALMIFCIGVVCYGASQLLGSKVRLSGVVTFVLGATGLLFIRPHMALIAIVSLGFAAAVGSIVSFTAEVDKKAQARVFAVRMTSLAVLIGAGVVATTQVSSVLGGGTGGAEGITTVLDRTKAQTADGGSQFEAVSVTSPADLPYAVVTVLFRPMPWEASNSNGLIASAEGMLLLALVTSGYRRVISWGVAFVRRPYLVFCAAYAVTFIVAFSYIGNFGILARQRTQMMPLALTVLGMPLAARAARAGGWFSRRRPDTETHPVERPVRLGEPAVGSRGAPTATLTSPVDSTLARPSSSPLPRGVTTS